MNPEQVLEKIANNRKQYEFISTGFPKLDGLLDGGFLKKELVVVGGSTGVGKSFLAIHFADKASSNGFKTGYFTLEISNELVISRMIAMRANIKASHILYGMYDKGDVEYNKALGHVLGLRELFHTHDLIYEVNEMTEVIKQQQYDFVVIDFIQNIMANRPDSYERLSYVALHLQRLAKEANTGILILSQLSNQVASAKNEDRPLEYKGSGSIATVADLGFFLHPVQTDETALLPKENTFYYDLLLHKNRRGRSRVSTTLQVVYPGGGFSEV